MNTLKDAIAEYREAERAFHACPDLLLSSWTLMKDPEGSKTINDRFFAARDRLYEATKASTDPTAQEWAAAHEAAQECPALVLANQSDEAAARMRRLNAAEAALLGM